MTLTSQTLEKAFSVLLDECLHGCKNDSLLVIYDESLKPFLDALTESACHRNIDACFLYISKRQQLWYVNEEHEDSHLELPLTIQAAVSEANIIINLLDGDLETSAVRKAIVGLTRRNGARLAHIPGVCENILNCLANTDIEATNRACDLIAWVLGEAQQVRVETHDCLGNKHLLSLDIDGWNNEPLIGRGVIAPGSWGNIPPAEVFCCPEISTVNGTVCINGSIPWYPMQGNGEVILTFNGGKLTEWKSDNCPEAIEFFLNQKAIAGNRRDMHWNSFAELGIGLNTSITSLTGNSLLDEKAAGTAHIAIGDNSGFGHRIHSDIHADLVFYRPTIIANNHLVLDHGVLQLDTLGEWRRTHIPSGVFFNDEDKLSPRIHCVEKRSGQLMRRLTKAHRPEYVRMANDETALALAEVFDELISYGEVSANHFLKIHPEYRSIHTSELLQYLVHYKVVDLTSLGSNRDELKSNASNFTI